MTFTPDLSERGRIKARKSKIRPHNTVSSVLDRRRSSPDVTRKSESLDRCIVEAWTSGYKSFLLSSTSFHSASKRPIVDISHASSNNVNATVGSNSIREAVSPLEDCKLEVTDLVAPSIAMSIRAPISVNSEGSCRK